MRLCSVEGCTRPHLARSWCATHYQRWRTTGDPGGADLLRVPGVPGAAEKRCSACKVTRPVAEFYREPRNTDGLGSHCRTCLLERAKNGRLVRLYGITKAQRDEVAEAQGHACPICRETRPLVTDHCHRTGAFRALLCDRCNRLLGVADDEVPLLLAAVQYLQEHTA